MTPAGVGKIPPGDPQPAFPSLFKRTNFPRMISQPSPRRQGKTHEKAKQARRFQPKLYKSHLSENGRGRSAEQNFNNEQAALFYQKNFSAISRPRNLPENSQMPTFPKKSRASHYLTKFTNARPAKRTWTLFFEARWRPFFLGKL